MARIKWQGGGLGGKELSGSWISNYWFASIPRAAAKRGSFFVGCQSRSSSKALRGLEMPSHPLLQDDLPRAGKHTLTGWKNQAPLVHNNCFCFYLENTKKKSTYMEVFMRDLYGIRHVGLFFGFHNAAPQGYDTLGMNQGTPISHQIQEWCLQLIRNWAATLGHLWDPDLPCIFQRGNRHSSWKADGLPSPPPGDLQAVSERG